MSRTLRSRLSALWTELDMRVGQKQLLRNMLDEHVPGGAAFSYVWGSLTLGLFVVQAVTGVVLAMYYSASATDAWASVAYLEREISGGTVVRGIHHYGAGFMVAAAGVHLLQVLLFGAYKKPREANWLVGLLLLGIVFAFALTGYLLPWDQTGYWATQVATSIVGTVPFLGESLQRVVQAGADYGSLTLTRFYAIHVLVLPALCAGLLGFHLYLFRRHGVTPHPDKTADELKTKTESFWPKQALYDLLVFSLAFVVLLGLAIEVGAPLLAPADPTSDFIARPEWYFLFLFQLLKYFKGPWQLVGSLVIPGLVSTFLFALPFLDRSESRKFRDRRPWLLATALLAGGMLLLTTLAVHHDKHDPNIAAQHRVAEAEAQRAQVLAAQGVPVEGASWMMAHDPLTRGARLFRQECASCHVIQGVSAPEKIKGPELTGFGSTAWIRQVLRDSDSPRLFGRTKVSGMKSFAQLSPEDLTVLVEFVYSRRSHEELPTEESKLADLLTQHECDTCHDFEAYDALDGPTLYQYLSPTWLKQMLKDPGALHFYGEMNDMPRFAEQLSDSDMDALVVYLQSLEHMPRAPCWPWVDEPLSAARP